MNARFEIYSRFERPFDAEKLLYAPIGGTEGGGALTCRASRVYDVEFEGEAARVEAFVRKSLLDPISEEMREGRGRVWAEALCVLEYGMKPGVLDLEREAILRYFRHLEEPGFALRRLTLGHRLYVFGEGDSGVARVFERDLVNPAIQKHELIES